MAAPTTTHSVTVRKLASTISSLWTKLKNTFAPKDDGLATHSTTKFYRADGSWAIPPTGTVSPAGAAGIPVFINSSGNPVACTLMGSKEGSLVGNMFKGNMESVSQLFFPVFNENWVTSGYLTKDSLKQKLNGVYAFSTTTSKTYTLYSDSATANLADGAIVSITNRGASGTNVTVKRSSTASTAVAVGTACLFIKSGGNWYPVKAS